MTTQTNILEYLLEDELGSTLSVMWKERNQQIHEELTSWKNTTEGVIEQFVENHYQNGDNLNKNFSQTCIDEQKNVNGNFNQ